MALRKKKSQKDTKKANEVVDMDKALQAKTEVSGLTAYQQYIREKIANATKK